MNSREEEMENGRVPANLTVLSVQRALLILLASFAYPPPPPVGVGAITLVHLGPRALFF